MKATPLCTHHLGCGSLTRCIVGAGCPLLQEVQPGGHRRQLGHGRRWSLHLNNEQRTVTKASGGPAGTAVHVRHLGARQTTHHQLLVFQTIVVFVIVSGSFCSARRLETSERRPVGLRVEGVDHDGLRAFDLAAAERAALTFRLLEVKGESRQNARLAVTLWIAGPAAAS